MQFSTLAALSLLGLSQAAIVTEVVYATAYEYQNVDVIVDQNGNPYTTVVEPVTGVAPVAAPSTSTSSSSSSSSTSSTPEPVTTTSSTSSLETSTWIAPSTSEAAPAPVTTTSTTPEPESTPTPTPSPSTHSHAEPLNYNYITDEQSSSSSSTSEYVAPTTSTSSTSEYVPPPQTTTSEAPAPTTSSSSGGSSGGDFSGDATYYSPGLGACGWTNGDSDFIAALNVDQFNGFGSMSNGNPACGKKATLNYNGKSTTVTITDKCPGCAYGDLDLSPAAFQALADESLGRIKITWSFD